MVPATRSGIDVSFWLLERAASERIAMSLPKLRWLLYLAQAHYAIARDGAKLMPATFVVGEEGPLEPTLDLVFQAGLENPWSPALSETALGFLDGFWKRFGALPAVALHKLVLGDPSWKRALENGPGSEIHVEQHRAMGRSSVGNGPKLGGGRSPGGPARSAAARAAELPPFEEEVKAKIAQYAKAGPVAGRVLRGTNTGNAVARQPGVPAAQGAGQAGTGPNAATPRTASVSESVAHLRAAPPDSQEIRFTADGRSVTRWRPKRRVDGPTI